MTGSLLSPEATPAVFPDDPGSPPPVVRPSVRFMLSHPAHFVALGFGSGLSRLAPGTSGTLWAWVAFIALTPWLSDAGWAWLIGLSLPMGWWASTVTARTWEYSIPAVSYGTRSWLSGWYCGS